MTCAGFSQDSTLLATGFSESYIRLWNLKGEKLRGMRSDFQVTGVKDGMTRSISLPANSHDSRLFSEASPRKAGLNYSQTDRPLWPGLYNRIRYLLSYPALPSLLFRRYDNASLVAGHAHKRVGISRTSSTCMGCSMGWGFRRVVRNGF